MARELKRLAMATRTVTRKSRFTSKVNVALALLISALALSSVPTCAEEPVSATDGDSQKVEAPTSENEAKASEVSGAVTELNLDKYSEEQIQGNVDLSQNEAIKHFESARFYMGKWDSALAEVELRAAIMYMPRMKVAHRDYCLVAVMRGKPLRALAEFMMVVGLGDPVPLNDKQKKNLREEAAGLHYNKGLEHAEASKWNEAISELLWARKYTPMDPMVHRSLAFAYASNNEFDKAQEEYSQAIELSPGDALAHADYAILLSDKGKVENAYEQMKKAVEAKPDSAALHVDLGWMAESKGDIEGAVGEFRHAVRLMPQQAVLWGHLGDILLKAGKKDEAAGAFKEVLKLDEGNDDAKTKLASLTEPVASGVEADGSEESTQGKTERPITPLKK